MKILKSGEASRLKYAYEEEIVLYARHKKLDYFWHRVYL